MNDKLHISVSSGWVYDPMIIVTSQDPLERPMHALYYTLLTLIIAMTLPFWVWRYFTTPKYQGTVRQRLGWLSQAEKSLWANTNPIAPRIWLHAVSVGEIMAARAMAARLLAIFPDHQLFVSTVTKTGQQVARQHLTMATATFYLPIDLPICLNPVIDAICPRFVVIMETELWPGVFRSLAKRNIPIFVVNGRISPRSFQRYHQIRAITRRFLSDGHLYLMQSTHDAQRLIAIGAPPERVKVAGNIKYDQALRPPDPARMKMLEARLPQPDQPVWIAASTHPGEEEVLLDLFQQLFANLSTPRLILVPRHPERTASIMALLTQRGLSFQCFSQTHGEWTAPILLVDEIGWLAGLYRWAHFVFIGGTLVPHGGQNMLEAAAWGVPVLFGPHTFNFPDIATQMIQAGAAARIQSPQELHDLAIKLLTDPQHHQRMSDAARTVIPANIGALDRTLDAIRHAMGS
ncbi:MAG: 3-deoxy-D-manno-octulosonic acid transferase [Magnetococcales bacterium]|nr:3-deoxy-D-manno-octulosonic acid transferase [Magnetococcales bacterium]MBF0438673.1 3-deoxy-D-manno-octulosonic acid transferase [Magnetococcales bacterium]